MKKIFILSSLIAVTLATPSFAEPTELDKKTVASKAYVDTKQDIIETGLVDYYSVADDETIQLPSLVSYGTGTNNADGILGNKIGILDWRYADDNGLHNHTGSEMDNFVPTVRAVASALQTTTWSQQNTPNIINTYQSSFPYDDDKLVNGYFLAKSLALKQNKIATSGKYYNASGTLVSYNENSSNVSTSWLHTSVKGTGLVTKTATEGRVGERKIFEASDVSNYHAANLNQNQQDIQDISIPTVGAMMTAISNGANAALPTGTTGTVVTYNGTNATTGVQEFTETAMTGTVTYTNGTLDNANDIATITAVGTRQKKKECGGYEPAAAGQPAHDGTHPGDEDYCWLWIFPED